MYFEIRKSDFGVSHARWKEEYMKWTAWWSNEHWRGYVGVPDCDRRKICIMRVFDASDIRLNEKCTTFKV